MNKLKKCTAMLLALLIAFSSLYVLPSELFPKVMATEIDAGETTAAYHYYDSYTYTYAEKEDGTLQLCYSDLSSDKEIESIVIPDEIDGLAVTELSANCLDFYSERRRVQTLSIGRNVRIINMEEQPFLKGTTISRIEVSEENPYFKSVDGVLFSKDGKKLICAPEFLQQEYTVPDGVEEIGDYAFYSCATIKKIVLSDSVCRIGRYALADQESYFNHDYWKDGSSANGNDGGYISIMGDNVVYSGDNGVNSAFYTVYPLTEVVFGSGTEVIGEHAFDHSGITTLTFPAALKEIDITAFENCESLTDLQVSEQNSVFKSFDGALCSDGGATLQSIEKVHFADGLETIGENAFAYNKLSEIKLPDSVKTIEGYAFESNPLTVIDLGNVETIGEAAFKGNSEVTSLRLGNQLRVIGDYVFEYDGDVNWNTGVRAFPAITELTLPDTLETIGSGFFSPFVSIKELTIGDSVREIGEYAFSGMTQLEKVKLSNNLREISNCLFEDCSNLKEVILGKNTTRIGLYAFYGCSSLQKVELGESITHIDRYAFSGCSSLEKAELGEKITYIGSNAFSGCASLTELALPDTVTHLDDCFISGCSGISSFTIPAAMENLNTYSFSGANGSGRAPCGQESQNESGKRCYRQAPQPRAYRGR